MRRIEYSRRREDGSCGVRGELLNRKSGGSNPRAGTMNSYSEYGVPAPRRTAAPQTHPDVSLILFGSPLRQRT